VKIYSVIKITSLSKFKANDCHIFIYQLVSWEEALGIQGKELVNRQGKIRETK
jgi:hypothetical protein